MPEHADALFSINRSLWDRVTPDLRGVSYLMADNSVAVRWFYAEVIEDWMKEIVSEAETECMADFWPTLEVSYRPEHLPIQKTRNIDWANGERWVFLRCEAGTDAR